MRYYLASILALFFSAVSFVSAANYQRKVICTMPYSIPSPSTFWIKSDFLHQTGEKSLWIGVQRPVASQITSPDLNIYVDLILGNFETFQSVTMAASINKGPDGYHDQLEQHYSSLKQSANGRTQTSTRGPGFSSSYAAIVTASDNQIGTHIHNLPPAPSSAGLTFMLDAGATYTPVEITISTNTPPTSKYYGAITGVINWGVGLSGTLPMDHGTGDWIWATSPFTVECQSSEIPLSISVNDKLDFNTISVISQPVVREMTITIHPDDVNLTATATIVADNINSLGDITLGGAVTRITKVTDSSEIRSGDSFSLQGGTPFRLNVTVEPAGATPGQQETRLTINTVVN